MAIMQYYDAFRVYYTAYIVMKWGHTPPGPSLVVNVVIVPRCTQLTTVSPGRDVKSVPEWNDT